MSSFFWSNVHFQSCNFFENSFPYVSGSYFSFVTQSCTSTDTVSSSSTIFAPYFIHFPILQLPLQPFSISGLSEPSSTPHREVNTPYSSSPDINSQTQQMSDIQPLNYTQSLPHIIHAAPPVGHPMITISKAGIFKLKSYIAALLATPSEPTSVSQVIYNPK